MELIGWNHLSGRYGNAGMRPERRLRGRNRSGRRQSFPSFHDSGGERDKSQGFGDGVPISKGAFPFPWLEGGQSLKRWAFLDEAFHSKEHKPQ
jgi:hypothetical protein